MSVANSLSDRYPELGRRLGHVSLAQLPTPVRKTRISLRGTNYRLLIKCDDRTGDVYGGNKVRKLEYLLHRAQQRNCERIATFGAVGSHHALATALYSTRLGFHSTCFLSHQRKTPAIPQTLYCHLQNRTDIVRYGGNYATRIALLREHLWGKNAFVIPAGGSSWLGSIGFVNAALELAEQVHTGEADMPDRVYVAAGTLGTVAGLAIGFALAGLPTEVQAIRVTEPTYSGPELLERLIRKCVTLMCRHDSAVPADLADRVNITLRHEFFGSGYAHSNEQTDDAVRLARDQMGIELETTYTGKAICALLADIVDKQSNGDTFLFWNTCNSVPLPQPQEPVAGLDRLPDEFRSYFT